LSNFVGKSSQGFIYISLGSGVNPSNMPIEFQDVFFNTIKRFPNIQFVWKWSGSNRSDSIPNLHVGEWFPQQDILGHPKLLAFITQAGKPSLQESICHGAPLITLPVMCDQDANAERLRELGVSITLDISALTEDAFQNAITEMVSSKKYKDTMTKLSKKFHDRPMKPADTALWWTEYVLRNDDTDHLKSLSINTSWFQRRLLDVWGAIFLAASISITTVLYVLLRLSNWYFGGGKVKKE